MFLEVLFETCNQNYVNVNLLFISFIHYHTILNWYVETYLKYQRYLGEKGRADLLKILLSALDDGQQISRRRRNRRQEENIS